MTSLWLAQCTELMAGRSSKIAKKNYNLEAPIGAAVNKDSYVAAGQFRLNEFKPFESIAASAVALSFIQDGRYKA